MADFDLVRYHVLSCIRAAMAESYGYQKEADRLRAHANLRLLVMSEEELRELARILSFLPSRTPEDVYKDIKKTIEAHKETVNDWIGAFGYAPGFLPEALLDH